MSRLPLASMLMQATLYLSVTVRMLVGTACREKRQELIGAYWFTHSTAFRSRHSFDELMLKPLPCDCCAARRAVTAVCTTTYCVM